MTMATLIMESNGTPRNGYMSGEMASFKGNI
jgi:hypothetical protein